MPDVNMRNNIHKARESFKAFREFDESVISPIILESWYRSRSYGLEMDHVSKVLLTETELHSRIDKHRELCEVSFPFLDSLYEFTNTSGLLSAICDEEGYVLKIVGQKYFNETPAEFHLACGSNRSERVVGTNGIGTVIATGRPVQVCANEHYYKLHEHNTCSGAPIWNPDHHLAGVFCLSGPDSSSEVHTLGLAIAVAEAISREMKLQRSKREQERVMEEISREKQRMDTIMEYFPWGVILLDAKKKITRYNSRACRLLGQPKGSLNAKQVESFLSAVSHIDIPADDKRPNEQIACVIEGKTHRFNVTLHKTVAQELLVTFEKEEDFSKKFTNLSGFNAKYTFSSIISSTPQMSAMLDMAKIAAENSANVLICGESGTGKELVAQAIHNASARAGGPFVAINCGALPKSLVESELFGYEGGELYRS